MTAKEIDNYQLTKKNGEEVINLYPRVKSKDVIMSGISNESLDDHIDVLKEISSDWGTIQNSKDIYFSDGTKLENMPAYPGDNNKYIIYETGNAKYTVALLQFREYMQLFTLGPKLLSNRHIKIAISEYRNGTWGNWVMRNLGLIVGVPIGKILASDVTIFSDAKCSIKTVLPTIPSAQSAVNEISFLKGSNETVSNYIGKIGQIIVNTTSMNLHLLDGVTPGGKVICGEVIDPPTPDKDAFHGRKGTRFDILSSGWVINVDTGVYEYALQHNLNITIADIDVRLFSGSSRIYLDYDYIDANSVKIISDEACDIDAMISKIILVKLADAVEPSKCPNKDIPITVGSWVHDEPNAIYTVTVKHNLEILRSSLGVSFYDSNNDSVYLDYKYVDTNSITIYSNEGINITVSIRGTLAE